MKKIFLLFCLTVFLICLCSCGEYDPSTLNITNTTSDVTILNGLNKDDDIDSSDFTMEKPYSQTNYTTTELTSQEIRYTEQQAAEFFEKIASKYESLIWQSSSSTLKNGFDDYFMPILNKGIIYTFDNHGVGYDGNVNTWDGKTGPKCSSFLTKEEYETLVSQDTVLLFQLHRISDLQKAVNEIWGSGKYDVKQWYKHTSGAFNTQSGYLAIPQAGGYGDTGLRTCVKVKNVVRTENGFKVEVYELECDYYGRAIYDNANNICISSSVAEWNASFDDMLKSSGVSLNKLGTKTYNLGVSDNEIYLIA